MMTIVICLVIWDIIYLDWENDDYFTNLVVNKD